MPGASNPLRRRGRAVLWTVAAVLLAGLGQVYFQTGRPALDGALFCAAGLALFWRVMPDLPPPRALPLAEAARFRQGSRLPGYVLLAAAAGASLAAAAAALARAPSLSPLLLVLAAGCCWIAGASFLDGASPGAVAALRGALGRLPARVWGMLIVLMLLAGAVRFAALDRLPEGVWYDEAAIGLEAGRVLDDGAFRPFYAQSTTSPAAYLYLVAGSEALFGRTVTAIRAWPALFGTVTVALAFVAGALLWGSRTGLAVAFLFAVARWDINFSRIGMQGESTPFFVTLLLVFALLALRTGRIVWYACLGVAAGVSLWFYSANFFFLIVLGALFVSAAVAQRGFLARHRAGLALAGAAVLLAVAPLAVATVAQPSLMLARVQSVSIFQVSPMPGTIAALRESLGKHLAMFHVSGDLNGRHNLPGAPMLDGATGLLMLFGLAAALRSAPAAEGVALIAWVPIMVLPGVLTLPFEAPQALRSIGALPGALLLAGLGWERMAAAFGRTLSRAQLWRTALEGAALIAGLNLAGYFLIQAFDENVWSAFSITPTLAGRHLARSHPDERVLVSEFYRGHPTLDFLSGRKPYAIFDASSLPFTEERPSSVFLPREEEAYYRLLQSYYPDASCRPIRLRPDVPPEGYSCVLEQSLVASSRGLAASARPAAASARGGWGVVLSQGSVLVPRFGRYRFTIDGPAWAELEIDGHPAAGAQEGVVLSEGLHSIAVGGNPPAGATPSGPARLLWVRPGGAIEEVPSSLLFHGNVRPMGLTGSYRPGSGQEGPVVLQRIDPTPHLYFHILPLPEPFTVEWEGSLFVEQAGSYGFSADVVSSAAVEIDGRQVLAATQTAGRDAVEALEPGWHSIRIRYVAADPYAHLYLRWRPPGSTRLETIPPAALRPG